MIKKLTSLSALLLAFGCIESPILKHRDASQLRAISLAQAAAPTQTPTCDLSFPTQKLCASWEWIIAPLDSDTRGEARIKFWNADTSSHAGPYVTPAEEVFVEPWMTSMGHGTRPPVVVTPETDPVTGAVLPGQFLAKPVRFIMWGDWDIRLQLRVNQRPVSQAIIPYFVP